ncbi:endonuclease/exonuclease/phosphatase family protein [Sphingomonas sp. KR1UV-12]|uniref:Endonuclease/exonuclease/phosphatase family protein n=1 Tax=Sphingomonas aurea TaxID=3063994 RepID=A0ABT9EJN9_9SPHN|nr:endonuclease/exonuclease/phosphatase family protein [Sphingomonas sp. KR1UV-12]MDP1027161.1 endonuclease/exonuclease/phosphatase family protein [Sphingomonas sp. KR1UV-12]
MALLLTLILACPATAKPTDLTVMTVNVRVPVATDGANDWAHRRALMAKTIARAAPDVIGTQELVAAQAQDLIAALSGYAWFGRDRRGGHGDEHMGIFYRTDRWRLDAQGDFWLSDTPGVPGSISWGHPYPRMVSWGRFTSLDGTHGFTLFDTHLPYRIDDEAARVRGARLLAGRVAATPGPVVVTGDFNAAPDSPTHATLAASLSDAWQVAFKQKGPAATFHGFTGKPDRRMDWIWTRGLIPMKIRTLTDHQGALYPSDHFPVVAELTWPAAKKQAVSPGRSR